MPVGLLMSLGISIPLASNCCSGILPEMHGMWVYSCNLVTAMWQQRIHPLSILTLPVQLTEAQYMERLDEAAAALRCVVL